MLEQQQRHLGRAHGRLALLPGPQQAGLKATCRRGGQQVLLRQSRLHQGVEHGTGGFCTVGQNRCKTAEHRLLAAGCELQKRRGALDQRPQRRIDSPQQLLQAAGRQTLQLNRQQPLGHRHHRRRQRFTQSSKPTGAQRLQRPGATGPQRRRDLASRRLNPLLQQGKIRRFKPAVSGLVKQLLDSSVGLDHGLREHTRPGRNRRRGQLQGAKH